MIITHASKDITDAIELLQRYKDKLFAGLNRESRSKLDLAIDCLDDCLTEAVAREEEEREHEMTDADDPGYMPKIDHMAGSGGAR